MHGSFRSMLIPVGDRTVRKPSLPASRPGFDNHISQDSEGLNDSPEMIRDRDGQ